MNAFDFTIIAMGIFGAVKGAFWFHATFGPPYAVLGVVLGLPVGVLLGLGLVCLPFYIIDRIDKSRKRPKCRKGCCKSRDYTCVEYSMTGGGLVFQCRCGDKYLRTGDRFMEMGDDGIPIPYMRANGDSLIEWEPDDGPKSPRT